MFDPSKLDINLEKDTTLKTGDIKQNIGNFSQKKEIIKDATIIESKASEEIKNQNNDILAELKAVKPIEKKPIENNIGKTKYEQSIEKSKKSKKNDDKNSKKKIVFDINLNSTDIVLSILVTKEYDFVTFEPSSDEVKVTFRKDKAIKEIKYIKKFPIYSDLLIKFKALANLTIEEVNQNQEGSGERIIKAKNYKVLIKVVPSTIGAKLFVKATPIEKKITKKITKKTSSTQILGFLGALAFIALIIGGSFIGFVAMNAQTVEDVQFFSSLGINLNDINSFISQAVTTIFSILIFIESIFLITYLFKFSLTKKEFKQKKIKYGIIGTLFLILTFATASGWMVLDQKVKTLPNWQELALGDIQLYDNSKLLSSEFDKEGAILENTSNLIGPVEVKFDLSYYAKNEESKGLKINKYIWDLGNDNIKETSIPTLIYNFDQKGNNKIKLILEVIDLQGKVVEKVVDNIPNINISYIVGIKEKPILSGGKTVNFDASGLKELGKVEWYIINKETDLNKPIFIGTNFFTGPIFEEKIIGMYIRRNDKISEILDKVFVISGENKNSIDGEIVYTRGIINDLEYEFSIQNIKNVFGNGYIEEFKWQIDNKIDITKKGDIINQEKSSIIKHTFKSYGKHNIKVTLTNSAGETKILPVLNIDIPTILKLKKPLRIFNDNEIIDDIKYESKLNEYYINEIRIPTSLKLDARFMRTENNQYSLKKVNWDYNSDGDNDDSGKIGKYDINTEGNHKIRVNYIFEHKKIANRTITIKEYIFIEGLKKDAIVDFKIKKDNNYAPIIIGFDGSRSSVKEGNIAKFIWDYGDGNIENGDSITLGHKYSTPGDYEVKLTIVTEDGKEFSKTKKLILKPKPNTTKITTSLKRAPVYQGIDFSSSESEGQIKSYFWNFGDGETSTSANPTHKYKKVGTYNVVLRLDFYNGNVGDDSFNMEIYEN